jgi:hypothetical protein
MTHHYLPPELCLSHADIKATNKIFDLTRLAYKNGTSINLNQVRTKEKLHAELSRLELMTERIPILKELHGILNDNLTRGIGLNSVEKDLWCLLRFFKFIDQKNIPLRLDDALIKSAYLEFSEHLLLQTRLRTLKPTTVYSIATSLGRLFGQVLAVEAREFNLINLTRLQSRKRFRNIVGTEAEKQNLADTFEYGVFITDICNAIDINTLSGELPLKVPLRSNRKDVLTFNGNLKLRTPEDSIISGKPSVTRFHMKRMKQLREGSSNLMQSGRWAIFNIKIEAEFILFCSQTGQNISQALSLEIDKFKYKSHNDSYDVISFKRRRNGEVLFTIYKSYKAHFQRYLEFLKHFLPNNNLLFPFFGIYGQEPIKRNKISEYRIKRLCQKYKIPWIRPKVLRNTRENWLLRLSGNEDLAAEVAQHTKAVLRSNYERPSQQRAMSEIIQFWNEFDFSSIGESTKSVIGSYCSASPEPIEHKPHSVVAPNCTSPSGCLWCKQHRDIDSLDYVWSLSSFLYLKTIEASMIRTRNIEPADHTINRLSQKLSWYKENRTEWYTEAKARITEEYFHPTWERLINSLELFNVGPRS